MNYYTRGCPELANAVSEFDKREGSDDGINIIGSERDRCYYIEDFEDPKDWTCHGDPPKDGREISTEDFMKFFDFLMFKNFNVGDRYIPLHKSTGCSFEQSTSIRKMKEFGNEFLYYSGVVSGDYTFSSMVSTYGDSFKEDDVIPYFEPINKKTVQKYKLKKLIPFQNYKIGDLFYGDFKNNGKSISSLENVTEYFDIIDVIEYKAGDWIAIVDFGRASHTSFELNTAYQLFKDFDKHNGLIVKEDSHGNVNNGWSNGLELGVEIRYATPEEIEKAAVLTVCDYSVDRYGSKIKVGCSFFTKDELLFAQRLVGEVIGAEIKINGVVIDEIIINKLINKLG